MKLDNFLQLFVVKEKRFFPLFIQAAENLVKASTLLLELAKEDNTDHREILSHRIKECETTGDTFTNRINDELLVAFVTPFDRDDIHELAQDIDTVVDIIRDSAKKIAIYQPAGCDEKITEMAEYIDKAAHTILDITNKFETIRKDYVEIGKMCNDLKEIEHIVDEIYASFLSHLFKEEKDAIELIKKKSIVQALEDATDAAKDFADTVRCILVKMG